MMEIVISERRYAAMVREVKPHVDLGAGYWTSPKVRVSPIFPYRLPCEACGGTGESIDATYCRKCAGAGEIETEGALIERGRMTGIIQNKLKPRFDPYFPAGLVRPPRMCRGLV